jgi:hypothetical protein
VKQDTGFARLPVYVLMSVEDDLHRKWRMPTHPDPDVTPVAIKNVERIVIHEWTRLLALDMSTLVDIPDRRLRSAHLNQEQPSRIDVRDR